MLYVSRDAGAVGGEAAGQLAVVGLEDLHGGGVGGGDDDGFDAELEQHEGAVDVGELAELQVGLLLELGEKGADEWPCKGAWWEVSPAAIGEEMVEKRNEEEKEDYGRHWCEAC